MTLTDGSTFYMVSPEPYSEAMESCKDRFLECFDSIKPDAAQIAALPTREQRRAALDELPTELAVEIEQQARSIYESKRNDRPA